jgi:hypothetical protein
MSQLILSLALLFVGIHGPIQKGSNLKFNEVQEESKEEATKPRKRGKRKSH